MTEEDEAFNEIERRSKVKQEILQYPSFEAQMKAEVTVLTEMVRVLSARLAELEAEKTLQALHDENERLGLYKDQE
jgi:hypothetical protein